MLLAGNRGDECPLLQAERHGAPEAAREMIVAAASELELLAFPSRDSTADGSWRAHGREAFGGECTGRVGEPIIAMTSLTLD